MNTYDLDKLVKAASNPCIPGFQEVDGTFLGHRYKELKDEIDNLEVNDSDIWVNTFPKSGTTWTQEMVWLIANDLDFEGAKAHLMSRFPFLEIEMVFDFDELIKRQEYKRAEGCHDSVKRVKTLNTNPRCIKTHLPWHLLPKSIVNKEKHPKIIYVIRNPKDACVSFYHHYKLLLHYEGTFEEFCTLFLNDKVLYAPYWQNLEGYLNQQHEKNILILRYEDMKSDLRSIIVKVANFLGKSVPENQMEKLLKHLSFSSMKENPVNNFVNNDKGSFIRKGIVGDYKNHMSPEMEKQFDKWIEENNKFGLTL